MGKKKSQRNKQDNGEKCPENRNNNKKSNGASPTPKNTNCDSEKDAGTTEPKTNSIINLVQTKSLDTYSLSSKVSENQLETDSEQGFVVQESKKTKRLKSKQEQEEKSKARQSIERNKSSKSVPIRSQSNKLDTTTLAVNHPGTKSDDEFIVQESKTKKKQKKDQEKNAKKQVEHRDNSESATASSSNQLNIHSNPITSKLLEIPNRVPLTTDQPEIKASDEEFIVQESKKKKKQKKDQEKNAKKQVEHRDNSESATASSSNQLNIHSNPITSKLLEIPNRVPLTTDQPEIKASDEEFIVQESKKKKKQKKDQEKNAKKQVEHRDNSESATASSSNQLNIHSNPITSKPLEIPNRVPLTTDQPEIEASDGEFIVKGSKKKKKRNSNQELRSVAPTPTEKFIYSVNDTFPTRPEVESVNHPAKPPEKDYQNDNSTLCTADDNEGFISVSSKKEKRTKKVQEQSKTNEERKNLIVETSQSLSAINPKLPRNDSRSHFQHHKTHSITEKKLQIITAQDRELTQKNNVEELFMPTRKVKSGIKGQPIVIETNHFELKIGKLDHAIHYDVTITPSNTKKMFRNVMEEFRKVYYSRRYPAFDGVKNLYAAHELPFDGIISKDVNVSNEGKLQTYKVVIKFANYVDFTPLKNFISSPADGIWHMSTPQEVLQCLDIVLRNAPELTFLPVNRSYFTPPKDQILGIGCGMEIYYGFYQSVILGWKPFLNMDVAHKAFPKRQNVIDLILELGDLKRDDLNIPLKKREENIVSHFLRTLKIRYEIPNMPASKRQYRVNGLEKTAATVMFKIIDSKEEISVEQYYRKHKKTILKYPHMPCLWVGKTNTENRIFLPAEFCHVLPGQVICNRKLPEQVTANMITKTASSTQVRKDKIMNVFQKAQFNNDPYVKEFEVKINNEFAKINARVLDAPNLMYDEKLRVKPQQGVWKAGKFLTAVSILQWTIVYLDNHIKMHQLEGFVKMMTLQATRLGIKLAPPQKPFTLLVPKPLRELIQLEELFKTKKGLNLIVTVIPSNGMYYGLVKQAAELTVGCLTQCLRAKTLQNVTSSTINNILQKINTKLEGTNHLIIDRLHWMSRPYMIMGADVTHPGPEAKDKPSIAAVTASFDPGAYKYNICYRLQPPKVEIIEDLEDVTKEQLLYFYKHSNGTKPERIIFYRDGVSEGQFSYVLNIEVQAIRRACIRVQPDAMYKPKITFLVVQKRHHTRFFPINPQDASKDQNLNVPVGTCVDTQITHPTAIEYCLASHSSVKGVTRPTKYRVLWDDANMSEDDLQQLSFQLCHLYSRCTKSVSYPTPTYYAHLAAARISAYTENEKLNLNNLKWEQNRLCIQDSIRKNRPMFFV